MKDLDNKPNGETIFDKLQLHKTKDGSISLYSEEYNEAFHSQSGALNETIQKFIRPSELNRFSRGETLKILDVCLGLGYNTCSMLDSLLEHNLKVDLWCLEIDKRPLNFALNNNEFISYWSKEVIEILNLINNFSSWEKAFGKGKVLWGDARKKIKDIPKSKKFDLILLDAFSPQKCPEMWSHEFLNCLSRRLSFKGRLITYCSASAIRNSLRASGLEVFSITPINKTTEKWSSGTIGFKQQINTNFVLNSELFSNLSQMEEEHLLTKASIPYRDPHGTSSREKIMNRRKKEQNSSILEATSSWKRRWSTAEYSLFN